MSEIAVETEHGTKKLSQGKIIGATLLLFGAFITAACLLYMATSTGANAEKMWFSVFTGIQLISIGLFGFVQPNPDKYKTNRSNLIGFALIESGLLIIITGLLKYPDVSLVMGGSVLGAVNIFIGVLASRRVPLMNVFSGITNRKGARISTNLRAILFGWMIAGYTGFVIAWMLSLFGAAVFFGVAAVVFLLLGLRAGKIDLE